MSLTDKLKQISAVGVLSLATLVGSSALTGCAQSPEQRPAYSRLSPDEQKSYSAMYKEADNLSKNNPQKFNEEVNYFDTNKPEIISLFTKDKIRQYGINPNELTNENKAVLSKLHKEALEKLKAATGAAQAFP